MNKNIEISVLMPAYNAEKFIEEAIRSVLNQTFTNFEFIIVNDGSTDSTEQIIQSFTDQRIKYLKQQNEGLASALNKGLQQATGKYIARFDADDICYPQRLEQQYQFIKENPSYVIVGSAVDYIDQHGSYIFTYMPSCITHEAIELVNKKHCPFIHSSVLYQKDVVLQYGGYNQHAHSFEDHFLWLSILKKGKGQNLKEPLIQVRLNPDSVTIDENWRPRNFHRIKTKVLQNQCIEEEDGQQLLQILQEQNTKEIKEGAYYALLAKKFLWNNYQPSKARQNLKKVLTQNKLHWNSYCLFCLSYLPPTVVQKIYRWVKSKSFEAIPI